MTRKRIEGMPVTERMEMVLGALRGAREGWLAERVSLWALWFQMIRPRLVDM